ncbi:MAG TPA: MBL fold metallo-hydrolase [Polyangiales bacterium]
MGVSASERAAAVRRERSEASLRFHQGKFRNIHPILPALRERPPMPPILDFFFKRGARRPLAPLPALDPRAALSKPADSGLRATWLGHSTLLLEIDGARVLTDPVWSRQLSPVPVLAPKRFQPVPLQIEALPPIDLVLISHDHFDHLDRPSIVRLARHGAAHFVTSLGVGAHLERWGVPPERIHELEWWEELELAGLRVTATPSQHFSGRGLGANHTSWTSFAVHGPRHSFFFSGDTGLTTEFQDVRKRLGAFDLVMLEVGAFHPSWGDIHLGPDNALTALEWLGGGAFLPVHWGTFDLGLHPWDEPAEQLLTAAPRRDVQLLMPRLGEAIEPAHAQQLVPAAWWRTISALEGREHAQQPHEPEAPQTASLPFPID